MTHNKTKSEAMNNSPKKTKQETEIEKEKKISQQLDQQEEHENRTTERKSRLRYLFNKQKKK